MTTARVRRPIVPDWKAIAPIPSAAGDMGPGTRAAQVPCPVPPGGVIASGAYSFSIPAGSLLPVAELVAPPFFAPPAGAAQALRATVPPKPDPLVAATVARQPECPAPPGSVTADGSYSFGLPPGTQRPRPTLGREAERPGPAGGAVARIALPDRPTSPQEPAIAAEGRRPGAAGSVVVVRPAGPDDPRRPAPVVARETDRPGQPGGTVEAGAAWPEEPTPFPVRLRPAATNTPAPDPLQPWVRSSRPQADPAPSWPGTTARDPGRPIFHEGWIYAEGTTGPPEPRPGVGVTAAGQAEAPARPAGQGRASASYDFGLPPGPYLPAVRPVRQAERAGFAGWVRSSMAAADARTPTPDPVFEFPQSAALVRFRFRKG